jgi:glyoxylase-like metal-dependent hydrolase (beta-lactamase superfamily II)
MKPQSNENMKERKFGPIWFLPGENKGNYPNCHTIYIEGPGIIIDPACGRERLLQLRDTHGIREVWLSHAHEDHIKCLGLFDDLPLALSEKDAPVLSHIDRLLDAYGVAGSVREFWREYVTDYFDFLPRKAAYFLKPGQVLDLGTVTVEIIGVPGHTPGHLAFLFKEPKVLFMGDYDLSKFGPWYGDAVGSIDQTIQSLNKLRALPAKTWLVSHGTGVFEKEPDGLWDAYLDVIRKREEKLINLLSVPHTLDEIVDACIVYWKKREPELLYDLGERGHMLKHLEKLVAEGKATRKGDRYMMCEQDHL